MRTISGGPLACGVGVCLTWAAIAAPAAAEVVERDRACHVASWAIEPAPPYFASEVGDAFTPKEAAFEDRTLESRPPLASDFSATVEWGDGTASPATVSEEGTAGSEAQCYQVRAPSHTYAAAGVYSLTFRVRAAETGLEHVFAPVTERIWTPVPSLRSGISSGVLALATGSSWSGTIASFGYEMEPFEADYSAMVNWGAGFEPASIPPPAPPFPIVGSFSINSTHTFETAYTGPVTVEISRAGTELGTWTVGQVTVSAEHPTSAKRPPTPSLKGAILAAVPGHGHKTRYLLAFKLSTGLKPGATGSRQTSATVFDRRSAIAPLTSGSPSDCYVATFAPPGRSRLKAGARYPFTLALEGNPDVTTDATLRRYRNRASLLRTARRTLDCG
jgi:hypothetical protein